MNCRRHDQMVKRLELCLGVIVIVLEDHMDQVLCCTPVKEGLDGRVNCIWLIL